jgi:hypothetical protein
MDGILEELLRLEGSKRRALIDLNAAEYEISVRQQTRLIEDPGISTEARNWPDKLLTFSKLAELNANLYSNLMMTPACSVRNCGGSR